MPLAALTAARAGKPLVITSLAQLTGQLAPLPLSALRWPEETLRAAGAGRACAPSGRCCACRAPASRAASARRSSPCSMRSPGAHREVRASFRPPERFRRRRELDYELTDHGRLLAALAPLFAALGEFLTARQCGVLELECRLWHRQAAPTRCVLPLAAPCADAQHLAALFGERLKALPLPDAGARLRAARRCAAAASAGLAARCGSPVSTAAMRARRACGLIELLRARLGAEAVHGLAAA